MTRLLTDEAVAAMEALVDLCRAQRTMENHEAIVCKAEELVAFYTAPLRSGGIACTMTSQWSKGDAELVAERNEDGRHPIG